MTEVKKHNQVSWWLSILDNSTIGASGRKFAAFTGIFLCVFLSIKFTTTATLSIILIIWLLFSLLLLGLITFEQITKFKNGSVVTTTTTETEKAKEIEREIVQVEEPKTPITNEEPTTN